MSGTVHVVNLTQLHIDMYIAIVAYYNRPDKSAIAPLLNVSNCEFITKMMFN